MTGLKELKDLTSAGQGDDASGWFAWSVDNNAPPCEVFLPETMNEHGSTLIFLHDEDGVGLVGRSAFESVFQKHGLRVIAPSCGRCWWSDRDTTHFTGSEPEETAESFVSRRLAAAIQTQFEIEPDRIGLFGIGMGGQGALRISYRNPNIFPVVAGIAPDLDYHLAIKQGDEVLYDLYGDTESARQDTAILHIHPLNWPRNQFFCAPPEGEGIREGVGRRVFEGADRLRMKMGSIGIMFECDIETKYDRKFDSYADQMADRAVQFLVDGLKKERLRIV